MIFHFFKFSVFFLIAHLMIILIDVKNVAYGQSPLKITSFGTVGYSTLIDTKEGEVFNRKTLEYENEPVEKYKGIKKGGTFARDTRFGLNIEAPLKSNEIFLSAQIVGSSSSDIDGEAKYLKTELKVFNVRFEPLKNTTVRLGLFEAPFLLISEERQIGYSYPFVRNPSEIDSVLQFGSTVQGISVSRNINYGLLLIRPSFTVGSFIHTGVYNKAQTVNADLAMRTANVRIEYENLLLGYGFHRVGGVVEREPRYGRQDVGAVDQQLDSSRFEVNMQVADMRYEGDRVLLMSELVQMDLKHKKFSGYAAPMSDQRQLIRSAYILLGAPIGRWLPRVSIASQEMKTTWSKDALQQFVDIFVNGNPSIPDIQKPYAAQSLQSKGIGLLNDFYDTKRKLTTSSVGVNFQWSSNIIVKAELERSQSPGNASSGALGLSRGSRADIFSTSVDVIVN